MTISDITFWLAFYAIVIGVFGDAFAVIHGIRWLQNWVGWRKAEREMPAFLALIALYDMEADRSYD